MNIGLNLMKECLFCKSSNLIKNGKPRGKQRWKCRDCKKNGLEGKKYSIEQQKRVIMAYIRGVGIRVIGDIEGIDFQLVFYWIKRIGNRIKAVKGREPRKSDYVEVIEMDDLFTYVGKQTKN